MITHRLSREEARRIALHAQLLTRDRPTDLLDLVSHLTLLQYDQTAAVAPNADLIAWSRLGSSYSPSDLVEALEDRDLIELAVMIRPAEDIALYRADMEAWPGPPPLTDWQEYRLDWVDANRACRHDILTRLRSEGPLTARDLPDTCAVPWSSSGWNNDRNLGQLLDFMAARGEIAVVGRQGRDRLWDLASRVFPSLDDPVIPLESAHLIRAERRLRSLGLSRPTLPEVGEPAVIEGVRGKWRVDPSYLGLPFEGRAALLSPLDRIVFDRKRLLDIFEFDYQLEMYKPVAKRRWGYFALPILYGDRLVGKLDATSDRRSGVFRVDAVHEDAPFTKGVRAAVMEEVESLAGWLGLHLEMPSGSARKAAARDV